MVANPGGLRGGCVLVCGCVREAPASLWPVCERGIGRHQVAGPAPTDSDLTNDLTTKVKTDLESDSEWARPCLSYIHFYHVASLHTMSVKWVGTWCPPPLEGTGKKNEG